MAARRHPVADRGRRFGRRRWRRWRSHGWQIAQCAVAAATSWWIASVLLGHERPFFAPVAAVVALGVSYAARLRQVGEVVAGVALGVAVGDVFVRLAGTGTWQIALVIAVAMSLAVLLNAGPIPPGCWTTSPTCCRRAQTQSRTATRARQEGAPART